MKPKWEYYADDYKILKEDIKDLQSYLDSQSKPPNLKIPDYPFLRSSPGELANMLTPSPVEKASIPDSIDRRYNLAVIADMMEMLIGRQGQKNTTQAPVENPELNEAARRFEWNPLNWFWGHGTTTEKEPPKLPPFTQSGYLHSEEKPQEDEDEGGDVPKYDHYGTLAVDSWGNPFLNTTKRSAKFTKTPRPPEYGAYEDASIEDYPFLVAILHMLTPWSLYRCTGVIVTMDWVLAPSICFDGNDDNVLEYLTIQWGVDVSNGDKPMNYIGK